MILLWLGIEPASDAQAKRLGRALSTLLDSDRSLAVSVGADGAIKLGASSEEQLEAAVDRLSREFKVEARITRPQIAYKEALTCAATGEAKYAEQTGGRGEYAHVKLRVEPGGSGAGYAFVNEIVGGTIPRQFIAPIAEAIGEALERGILSGHPVSDVRVTLCDGSYHDVDSSEAAFRLAASLALRNAAAKARPMLLEPMMNVEVLAPALAEPAVTAQVSGRRGEVLFLSAADNSSETVVIRARVPLSGLFGFGADLRRRTQGAGSFTMTFSHYAPVARGDDDRDREAGVTSPLAPRTPPRSLSASIPEPREDFVDGDL